MNFERINSTKRYKQCGFIKKWTCIDSNAQTNNGFFTKCIDLSYQAVRDRRIQILKVTHYWKIDWQWTTWHPNSSRNFAFFQIDTQYIYFFYYFQPFTVHPKRNHVCFGILLIWIFSLAIAAGPLMETDNHMIYQTALMNQNPFFRSWDVSFDTLQRFTIKLLQFHPNMKNLTDLDVEAVANTKSWLVLSNFLQSRFSENFTPKNYYG